METVRKLAERAPQGHPDIEPADLPTALGPEVALDACRLIARAEAMGLVDLADSVFDAQALDSAIRAVAAAGVGRQAIAQLSEQRQLSELVKRLNVDIEDTPVPRTEWSSVVAILGVEETSELVGVSVSSARRYQAGGRTTPDLVAARLHFLALVIADLLGAYNAYGVRRWFDRPRTTLGGKSPKTLLNGDWDPTEKDPGRIAALAAGLLTMSAT